MGHAMPLDQCEYILTPCRVRQHNLAAVQNVACVPMPDPILGERMCACVILRHGSTLTLQQLVAFLMNEEIAKHKLPERLEIRDDFPLSPFGKVSKKDLTERIALKLKEEGKI